VDVYLCVCRREFSSVSFCGQFLRLVAQSNGFERQLPDRPPPASLVFCPLMPRAACDVHAHNVIGSPHNFKLYPITPPAAQSAVAHYNMASANSTVLNSAVDHLQFFVETVAKSKSQFFFLNRGCFLDYIVTFNIYYSGMVGQKLLN